MYVLLTNVMQRRYEIYVMKEELQLPVLQFDLHTIHIGTKLIFGHNMHLIRD